MNKRILLGVFFIIVGIFGLAVFSTIQFIPTYTGSIPTAFQTTPPALSPLPSTPQIPAPYRPNTSIPTNIDEATDVAESYVASLGYPDLAVKEIMEFQYNYYFIVYEKSTGIGAFEGVIEKGVGLSGMGGMMGVIHPEQGPSMMWNTKYGGMMGRGWRYQPYSGVPTANMSITKTDAKQLTQSYLKLHLSGSSTEEPDTFYGYYTIHVLRDGKVYGMLSVNGYTGQVWYHTWHGAFIQMKELT